MLQFPFGFFFSLRTNYQYVLVVTEISRKVNVCSLQNCVCQDAAMGLALSAAAGRGWTTGSGMEGPPVPDGSEARSSTENVSTFPWSLFTKSPRRRMLVAFTCNICGQRTTRAINPHAYTDGTVFVQVNSLQCQLGIL